MILQLKVTLKDMKPPIWRRLQVQDSISFYELHQILQIAFGWTDTHLHGFDIRKVNTQQINDPLSIGINDDEGFLFSEYDYDEHNEVIGDWLVAEKDRCIYTYDFGDDWQHEIVLEKILMPEQGTTYPTCIKAMRNAPDEDSRGSLEEIAPINHDELREIINSELRELAFDQEDCDSGWSELFSVVETFKQLQPWKWMDDNHIFAVHDQVSNQYVYCSVMGAAEQEFGLAAYIGVDGLRFLNKLFMEEIDELNYLEQRSILLSLSDRNELSSEDYELIKAHGLSYRGKKQWPQFRSFKPGLYQWILDQEEVRLLTVVLEQAIIVCKSALQDLSIFDATNGWYFAREINKDTGEWRSSYISQSTSQEAKEVPLFLNELELQGVRNSTNRLNVPLEFDASFAKAPIQDNPGERPYFPNLILCLERKKGLIIHQEFIGHENFEEDVQNSFLHLIQKMKGIPREVWVKENVLPILNPVASKLKVKLIVVQHLPLLDEALREMNAFLSRR